MSQLVYHNLEGPLGALLNHTKIADASLISFWTEKCPFEKKQLHVPCFPESVCSCAAEFRLVLVASACTYHTLTVPLISELAICNERPIFPSFGMI